MPTTTRTVFLTDENGNALIDTQGNMRALSFSLVQGYSYRLVERASIVSATYEQIVGYSTATGQTISGVENASEFDVGDFGIVQYAISDRNNTIGYVTCEVTAVDTDSLTVNGIGISVAGADGVPGAGGATFTPSVDTNGNLSWTNDGGLPNPETVNVRGAQGEAATVQVGETTTLPAGRQATVNNSGTSEAAVLNFGIPTGQPGADGQAATIAVGEVTTGAAGSQASVTNSGNENAAVLDFTIPQGADGASGVTDVTTGTPTEQDGYTVTPVTFNFEQGNSKTVEIKAKNGEGGGGSSTSNIVDIGTVSDLTFGNAGEVEVPVSADIQEQLENAGGTILKFKDGTNQDIFLQGFVVGNGVIYTGVMAASGTTLSYSAHIIDNAVMIICEVISSGGGGVEVIDLGTVTPTQTDGVYSGTVTITSEQYTKMKAETPPIVNFEWEGETYSLSRFVVTPNAGGGKDSIVFSGTVAVGLQNGGVDIQSVMLFASAGSTDSTITADIVMSVISLSNEGSGVEIVDLGTVNITPNRNSVTVSISDDTYNKLTGETPPILRFTVLTTFDGVSNFAVELPRIRRGGTPAASLGSAVFGAADTSVMYDLVKNYYWRALVASKSTGYEVNISCAEGAFAQPN